MTEQLANSVYNPTAQLSVGINSSVTSLTVSDVSEFIDTAGAPLTGAFRVMVWDGATDASKEIIKVGAFDSGTGVCSTLTRAVEGKNAAQAHAAGDLVELVISAGGLEDYVSDHSGGGPQHLRVVLGPDELLTLKSAAVELVAAPDAGHLLWPLSLVLITAPGGVAYDVLDNVLLSWGPAPPGDYEFTNNISTSGAAQVVTEDVAADLWNNASGVEVGVIAEQPLLLHSNDASDSAVGDGTITVHLDYLILEI